MSESLDSSRGDASLTPREHEVLDYLAAGRANKVIAIELGISMRTVEAHRARIFRKLGVRNVLELICRLCPHRPHHTTAWDEVAGMAEPMPVGPWRPCYRQRTSVLHARKNASAKGYAQSVGPTAHRSARFTARTLVWLADSTQQSDPDRVGE